MPTLAQKQTQERGVEMLTDTHTQTDRQTRPEQGSINHNYTKMTDD